MLFYKEGVVGSIDPVSNLQNISVPVCIFQLSSNILSIWILLEYHFSKILVVIAHAFFLITWIPNTMRPCLSIFGELEPFFPSSITTQNADTGTL